MPTWPNFVSTRPVIVTSSPMISAGLSGLSGSCSRLTPATNSALEVVAPRARVSCWSQMPESALNTLSKFEPYRSSMPVTMPWTVTVLPSHADPSPSVWMSVIATMPSVPGTHVGGTTGPPHVVPHLVGVGVSGPVKSATLSSVSMVPPFLRAKPPAPLIGCARPAPSRQTAGAPLEPNASRTTPPASRIWAPPVLAMPVPYCTSLWAVNVPAELANT